MGGHRSPNIRYGGTLYDMMIVLVDSVRRYLNSGDGRYVINNFKVASLFNNEYVITKKRWAFDLDSYLFQTQCSDNSLSVDKFIRITAYDHFIPRQRRERERER